MGFALVRNTGGPYTDVGTYAAVWIDAGVTDTLNVTSTGPNAFCNWRPTAFGDAESGLPALLVTDGSTVSAAGTYRGGNGAQGVADEGDGIPDLQRPAYGPGEGALVIDSAFDGVSGATFQGGNWQAGAAGSDVGSGAAGAKLRNPTSTSITNGTYTGGASEPTQPAPPGLAIELGTGTTTYLVNGPICVSGSGVSGSESGLTVSTTGARIIQVSALTCSDPITVGTMASGASLRFAWFGGFAGGTLTTSSVSGVLASGMTLSTTIVGAAAAAVYNDPGGAYSELQF